MKLGILIAFTIFLFVLGSYCLFLPRKVQGIATQYTDVRIDAVNTTLQRYVRSESYLATVQFVGVIAYLMSVVLAFAVFRGGGRP